LNESEIESAAVEGDCAQYAKIFPETAIPSSELVEVVNEVSATVDTSTSDDTWRWITPPEALEAPERPIKPKKTTIPKKLGR